MAAAPIYIGPMSRGLHHGFISCLDRFCPDQHATTRALALYSAAIAVAEPESLRQAQAICRKHGATDEQVYETMLQSYLFLGFPRMLTAAKSLLEEHLVSNKVAAAHPTSLPDTAVWLERGRRLCRRVYDSNYEALKSRVEAMAPEIFLWMELEGYGKVLSRPGLDIVDREIAIVACLIIENRPVQLHSHLRGALNVGAPRELIRDVVSDMAPLGPEGHGAAVELMGKLEL